MGSVVETSTYQCTCDLCGHGPDSSPTAVPEGWAQVTGPNAPTGPPIARKKLLCVDCYAGYKTFWKLP